MSKKKRVTIADVARKAGVSKMTISRVLNNKAEISPETRAKIERVIRELGYRPSRVARGLAMSQTFILGLVVPDISNPFFAEIARGAEDVAWENGYNILLCNTEEIPLREKEVLQLLEQTQIDGLIICSARLPDDQLLPLIEKYRAVVMFNRPVPGQYAGLITMNDVEGAKQAVQHLLKAGRQHIGLLADLPRPFGASRERVRGYSLALAEAGHPVNPQWQAICQPTQERVYDRNWQGGYLAARQLLLAHPEIDGLVCHNDLIAMGGMHACQELGRRVPQDVAIVGCDDILVARMVSPALTTLHVPKYDIGAMAVQMLLDRVQGQVEQAEIIIEEKLIVRASAP